MPHGGHVTWIKEAHFDLFTILIHLLFWSIGHFDPLKTMIQEDSMYIRTLLSDRLQPPWSTHTTTQYIGFASNTGLFSLLYCSPPCFLSSR